MTPSFDNLDPSAFKEGSSSNFTVSMCSNVFGQPYNIPVMLAKGAEDGPLLGITSAMHGNELNGIFVIHRLMKHIDTRKLRGTVAAVPAVNVQGVASFSREFSDGSDLNRLMPGKDDGNESQQYAHQFISKIVRRFDYLVDLHTASFGRVNSLYARVNFDDETARRMAFALNPRIILDNAGPDGSLRGACFEMGIPAVTVETGNPQVVHQTLVDRSLNGILEVLDMLEMYKADRAPLPRDQAVVCKASRWLYTHTGGLLHVRPAVGHFVEDGETLAVLTDIYGNERDVIRSPGRSIVIGKSSNPVAHTGSRIIHLGFEKEPG